MKSFGKAEITCKIKTQIICIYSKSTVFNNCTQILTSEKKKKINRDLERVNKRNKTLAKPRTVPHATVIFKRLQHLVRMKYDNIFIIFFMSDPQKRFTMANVSKYTSLCLQVAKIIHR